MVLFGLALSMGDTDARSCISEANEHALLSLVKALRLFIDKMD